VRAAAAADADDAAAARAGERAAEVLRAQRRESVQHAQMAAYRASVVDAYKRLKQERREAGGGGAASAGAPAAAAGGAGTGPLRLGVSRLGGALEHL
jgi:hypothetical protein